MDEQQVRALVREAIARHLGAAPGAVVASDDAPPSRLSSAPAPAGPGPGISHAHFHLVRSAGDVECLIEPTVTCNHCGYCLCYGH